MGRAERGVVDGVRVSVRVRVRVRRGSCGFCWLSRRHGSLLLLRLGLCLLLLLFCVATPMFQLVSALHPQLQPASSIQPLSIAVLHQAPTLNHLHQHLHYPQPTWSSFVVDQQQQQQQQYLAYHPLNAFVLYSSFSSCLPVFLTFLPSPRQRKRKACLRRKETMASPLL